MRVIHFKIFNKIVWVSFYRKQRFEYQSEKKLNIFTNNRVD